MHSAKGGGLSAVYRKLLRIEPLESRRLMNAAGLASQIAPMWFQTVASPTGVEHAGAATWTAEDTIVPSISSSAAASTAGANLYDWIVQFNTASLAGISSVAQTTSLLAGGGIDFEVLHGLGLAGMVLVRSSGASFDAVEHWLASDTNVANFEQDAYRAADATCIRNNPTTSATSGIWPPSTPLPLGISPPAVRASWWPSSTRASTTTTSIWPPTFGRTPMPATTASSATCTATISWPTTATRWTTTATERTSPAPSPPRARAIGVTGVAYSTSIMPLKFLDANGSGYLSDAIEAINYATMERTVYGVNVRVDNCSWGGGGFSAAMQSAIQAAGNAGILVVTAAGNSGTNNDTSPQYPANYNLPNVISVAASTQNNQLASFSNYGATTVDIAAPGVSIYSTTPNNTYSTYSGTSMATPHVSAVAALAWALDPNATVAAGPQRHPPRRRSGCIAQRQSSQRRRARRL